MKRNNDHICNECLHLVYDVIGNARCYYHVKDSGAPVVYEYLPACFRFKDRQISQLRRKEDRK